MLPKIFAMPRGAIRTIWLALTLTVGAPFSHAAEIPGSRFNVNGWNGVGLSTDDGQFSACIVHSPYRSGITLAFIFDADDRFVFALRNNAWQLRLGARYPVTVWVDRAAPLAAEARALSGQTVEVPLPVSSDMIQLVRRGVMLNVQAAGTLMQFRLDGSSVALDGLRDCYLRHAAAPRNANPFEPSPTSRNPFEPTSRARPFEPRQFAAALFRHSDLSDFEILSGSSIPEALRTEPVVWRATNTIGTMSNAIQMRRDEVDAQFGRVIGGDRQSCRGEFASGSRSEAVANDISVFRTFTACRLSDTDTIYMQYLLLPLADGRWVLVSHLSTSATAARDAEQRIVNAIRQGLASR